MTHLTLADCRAMDARDPLAPLRDQFELPANAIKVGSRTYQDFQLTFDVKKQVQLYLGIDNAFDTAAPMILSGVNGNSTGTNTDAGTYDPIGRRYYVGLRVTM